MMIIIETKKNNRSAGLGIYEIGRRLSELYFELLFWLIITPGNTPSFWKQTRSISRNE
jgi:hypothetical protein